MRKIVSPIVSLFRTLLEDPRQALRKVSNQMGAFYCPVCEKSLRRFYPFGDPPRPYAQCPHCGSLERHRLDWVFFKQKTNLFEDTEKSFLHVAPEAFLSRRFRDIPKLDYLSVDLNNPAAMEKMDITEIPYPNESFSSIYCSHVLEHIPDDRKAIGEFYRVLKSGGWAVLQVPINLKETYEDFNITSPEGRKKHFGQWDHVRSCGPDYANRMKDAGFQVDTIRATDLVSRSELDKIGVQDGRVIFYCRK